MLHPRGGEEQRRGLMPLGLFLFSTFLVVTCPRPPVFARPNILVASFATQAIVASFATQARVCILSDHNIFYTPSEGGNGGVMPLGLFLFLLFSIFLVVTCPRPPVFARPNILVASFATQARACILSDHNIFYTPRGGENGGVMPLGLFLFFLGHLPQTPGFRSARQILAVSFATRARNCILSDLNMFYTPRGGRTTAGSNAPGAFLVCLCCLCCSVYISVIRSRIWLHDRERHH